jgi:hypothetical protein
MSMVGSLGGDAGDLRASTTYLEDIDGGSPGSCCQRSGVLTTYLEDVDGTPLGGDTGCSEAPTIFL